MAFDGIITRAAAHELSEVIVNSRIDKIYEPEPDSIVLNIRTMDGVVRLLASCHSAGASLRLITSNPENPKEPFPFCMLLRKHIQGSKIVSLEQRGAERIIEMTLERLNELGLMVQKKLIFEIMGKYSNIVLVDMSRRSSKPGHAPAFGFGITDTADTAEVPGISAINSTDSPDQLTGAAYTTGAAGCMILGSIKGIPSGLSRVREVLPGRLYEYPPQQDKIPFDEATPDDLSLESDFASSSSASENADDAPFDSGKNVTPYNSGKEVNASRAILSKIGGISPAVADELAALDSGEARKALIDRTLDEIENSGYTPRVYEDENGIPREYHIIRLSGYESLNVIEFDTLSECMDYYYEHREATSRITQRSNELSRPVTAALDKLQLKKQRLLEDLLRAEDSDKLRLYGELLTANISQITQGASEVTVTSYYDGSDVTIPLDPRWSPSKNAQSYYKRYAKSKTAVKEKTKQLEDTGDSIEYLESCLVLIDNADSIATLETLRSELEETGYIRRRRARGQKPLKFKAAPRKYTTTDGFTVLVGRNNRENDVLTLEMAAKGDYWLHTKDIPGSHVILRSEGREISDTAILEAARLAALYSKAKNSENVPVDYIPIRYVKKPSGAKPGKVIFTHNRTVYVDPGEPDSVEK